MAASALPGYLPAKKSESGQLGVATKARSAGQIRFKAVHPAQQEQRRFVL